jgi:hypothetical protein
MLIAFSGRKGSGKTTAAKMLVDDCGFHRLRFAGPMKRMIRVLLTDLGYTDDAAEKMVDGPLKESEVPELDCTPRHLLQTIGTDWGRAHVRDDMWPIITMNAAERLLGEGRSVVIDDCRFPNEAEAVRARGGIIVELHRISGSGAKMDTHESEKQVHEIDPDYVVANNGGLDRLRRRVTSIVTEEKQTLT